LPSIDELPTRNRGPRRRTEVVPPAVTGELVRRRLIDRLDGRWEATVTTVVAGPGFGKSTALAQAVRANLAHPRGIDAWVSCEPGDEDGDQLGLAILRAIGVENVAGRTAADGDIATAIVNGLRLLSPVPVCLVIDDLHELPDGSSGMGLIAETIRRLPAHTHVVLAGRRPIPLPLARLRVADRLLEITRDELALTPAEVEVLAAASGHDLDRLADLGGWPALVRLALAAPAGARRRYLWEEVVDRLEPGQRCVLLALAMLGTADAGSLLELCGRPVDLDHLVATIPLVVATGDGRVRAHDLWHETLTALLPADDVRSMGRAAFEQLLATGGYLRAGSLAARIGDHDGTARASLILIRDTLSALPVDTAAGWLDAAPPAERSRPELVLLAAALDHARCDADPTIQERLDTALAGFRARDGAGSLGETVTLALMLVLGHTRGDLALVGRVIDEVNRLPDAERDPVLGALPPAVAATEADLLGEPGRAAELLGTIAIDRLPSTIAETVLRLRWHALVLDGRADEAAVLGPALVGAPTPNATMFTALAKWSAGDPSGFDGVEPLGLAAAVHDPDRAAVVYPRDWFNYGFFTTVAWSGHGDRHVVARALQLMATVDVDLTSSRDAAQLAVAKAANAVLNHDDEAAADVIDRYLVEHPPGDRWGLVALRRFPAVPYVCSPELRRLWDDEPTGPSHLRQREAARALLAAREGGLSSSNPLPAAPLVFTALPLPWSVELACRAHAAGHPDGARLAQWLVDRLGTRVCDELRHHAAAADVALARGAAFLLRSVPVPPAHTTRIEVIGPLRLVVDGRVVERAEQRRTRVRELLALLVVFGSISRERIMDLLWYDLAPADAARNLRVTLTHLRRWLEPERSRGDVGFHLRVEGELLRLVASPRLEVDAWELQDHLQAATAARNAGDVTAQARHLERAVGLWRGRPLIDLDRLPDLAAEAEHLGVRLAEAALTLGELRLAEGDTSSTIACAERVLAVDPYAERALRLLLAGHLQRGDRSQARNAAQRATDALAELGLPPEPATAILLRQAGETKLDALSGAGRS
jgi:DNA-binding SARP family transcriptional activator